MPEEKKEGTKEKETPKKEASEKKVPAKFKDLVASIEKMSVLELSELVKILEDKFQVSAAAPVAVTAAGAASGESKEEEEEKTEFDIEIKEVGGQKIQVIKAVKEITGKGLKDAKDTIDKAPVIVKEKVAKDEAEELKKKLESAGATIELK